MLLTDRMRRPALRLALPLASAGLMLHAQPAAAPAHVFGNPRRMQYAPSRRYHVINYRIRLRLEEQRAAIAGAVTITLRPLVARFRSFYLDSSGLSIESVSLLPGASQAGTLPLAFRRADPRLWIKLPRAYAPADRLRIRIAYHGAPRRGLTFIHPSPRSPRRPVEVWSYGWPTHNHDWFPCWDYPNDKATSETIITVPGDQSVVSNGKLRRVTHAGGLATYDWRESVPHSAYLVSIAAARWTVLRQKLGKLSINAYVPPGVSLARARRSFGLTPDMIAFYRRIFGFPYPYEKYAQVAAHDFPGGLENISATTLTDLTLHSAAAGAAASSLGLVSHELAHQWFGDLVTERSWANAWLSEGFATFAAALYAGHHAGPHAYRYQIWLDQNAARAEDRDRYRRPIVDRHYTQPWGILDRTTYEKGAAVLDMLRMTLDRGREPAAASPGEPLFRALSAYLRRYRARNVDTHDLLNALRRSTARNLRWFFDQWIYGAGYPQYRIAANYDARRGRETIRIEQTQATADQTARVFTLPVELALNGARGQSKKIILEDRKRRENFTIPIPYRPRWVDFDPHDFIYKTVVFPQPTAALMLAARRDPIMMARLNAIEQLARLPKCGCGVIATLGRAFNRDAFFGVRIAAAQALGRLRRPRAMRALLAATKPADVRVRAADLLALGTYSHHRAAFAQLARSLRTDPSPAVEATAARALGRPGSPADFSTLRARLRERPRNRRVWAAAVPALAATRDPRAPALLKKLAAQAPTRMLRQMAARLAGMGAQP